LWLDFLRSELINSDLLDLIDDKFKPTREYTLEMKVKRKIK